MDDPAPKDSGLFLVDLKENTSELLISLSELAQMEDESYRQGYMHFVTHSEFSKDGRYLSFLYRKIPTDGDYMRIGDLLPYLLKSPVLIMYGITGIN